MIKILGFLIIFLSSILLGFLKAYSCEMRIKNLEKTVKELKIFSQKVKLGESEFEKILSENLKENYYKNFEKKERKILSELFENFGTREKNLEYERILIYIERLENVFLETKEKTAPLLKLYKTLGFLVGLFICIFLI